MKSMKGTVEAQFSAAAKPRAGFGGAAAKLWQAIARPGKSCVEANRMHAQPAGTPRQGVAAGSPEWGKGAKRGNGSKRKRMG